MLTQYSNVAHALFSICHINQMQAYRADVLEAHWRRMLAVGTLTFEGAKFALKSLRENCTPRVKRNFRRIATCESLPLYNMRRHEDGLNS